MSPSLQALATAAVALALGCSSSPTPAMDAATSQCAQQQPPTTCPSPAPTYADVSPLLTQKCVPCHATNTGGQDESTYAAIAAQRGTAYNQVGSCIMPPQGSPQLSADERTLLLTWLVCGAPQ